MIKYIIVYHNNDLDGFMGLAVIKKYLLDKDIKNENIFMIGGNYVKNNGIDEVNNKIKDIIDGDDKFEIFIVDYHIEPYLVEEIIKNTNCIKIYWYDHHISAIKKYLEKDMITKVSLYNPTYSSIIDKFECLCRTDLSGCYNAYIGLNNIQHYETEETYKVPLVIYYTSIYDTWKLKSKDFENASYINLGLQHFLEENDYNIYSLIDMIDYNYNVKYWIDSGVNISFYVDSKNRKNSLRYAFDVDFEGYKFIAINTCQGGSRVIQDAAKEYHDGLMVFNYTGKEYKISMYKNPKSEKDIDFSKIAVKYGGGGHAGACGFSINKLPFNI